MLRPAPPEAEDSLDLTVQAHQARQSPRLLRQVPWFGPGVPTSRSVDTAFSSTRGSAQPREAATAEASSEAAALEPYPSSLLPSTAPAATTENLSGTQVQIFGKSLDPAEQEEERALVEQLRDRVRALNVELQASEARRLRDSEEAEQVLYRVRREGALNIQKYIAERDKLQAALEAQQRKKAEEIEEFGGIEELPLLKERLERLEAVSRQGWEQVGLKNMKLQKMRKRLEDMTRKMEHERSAKEAAHRIKGKMESRLQPLVDKNMQMEYRLSLQHNLYMSAVEEAKQTGNELIRLQKRHKELTEQANGAFAAKSEAVEHSSRTSLAMHDLSEEHSNLANELNQTKNILAQTNRRMATAEEEMENMNKEMESLRSQLDQASKHNAHLEATLEEKERELSQTRNELSDCQLALEAETEARETLDARCAALEDENSTLNGLLHAPMLESSSIHYTLKSRYGSTMQLVRHHHDSPAAVSNQGNHFPRPPLLTPQTGRTSLFTPNRPKTSSETNTLRRNAFPMRSSGSYTTRN